MDEIDKVYQDFLNSDTKHAMIKRMSKMQSVLLPKASRFISVNEPQRDSSSLVATGLFHSRQSTVKNLLAMPIKPFKARVNISQNKMNSPGLPSKFNLIMPSDDDFFKGRGRLQSLTVMETRPKLA